MTDQEARNKRDLTVEATPSKDDIRSKIFSSDSKKPKSQVIEFFGSKIEIRQASLTEMMDQGETGKNALVKSLISSAYIPGTDEKVFTPEDYDQLAALPYGDDFNRLLECLKELRVVNF